MRGLILTAFMETPKIFGWYHIMWIVAIVVLGISTLVFTRKKDDKQIRIFLICYLSIMLVCEVIKQIYFAAYGLGNREIRWNIPWEVFPLQFSTMPILIISLALIFKKLKKESHYNVMITFLTTYSFLVGVFNVIYPFNSFTPRVITNISVMMQSGIMVLFGLHAIKSGRLGNLKDFLKASYIFLIFITTALLTNVIFNGASNRAINSFYINPLAKQEFPLIGKLMSIDYLLFIFVVILLVNVFAALIYLIARYIHVPLKYVRKGFNIIFKKPYGKWVLLGLFFLLNILGSSLFFNNKYFTTLVFPIIPFAYKLNAIISDILLLGMITFVVCYFIKNTKGRLYTLFGIGMFFAGFNIM